MVLFVFLVCLVVRSVDGSLPSLVAPFSVSGTADLPSCRTFFEFSYETSAARLKMNDCSNTTIVVEQVCVLCAFLFRSLFSKAVVGEKACYWFTNPQKCYCNSTFDSPFPSIAWTASSKANVTIEGGTCFTGLFGSQLLNNGSLDGFCFDNVGMLIGAIATYGRSVVSFPIQRSSMPAFNFPSFC
jgi:hypothetical protein